MKLQNLSSLQYTTGLSCNKLQEGTLPTDSIVSNDTHSYDTRHRYINKFYDYHEVKWDMDSYSENQHLQTTHLRPLISEW